LRKHAQAAGDVRFAREARAAFARVDDSRGRAFGHRAVRLVHPRAHALKFGIAPEIIEAIRERRTPDFSRDDERLVYDITIELNTTRILSDVTYQCGMVMFGEQVLIELVSAIGFYAMVAMTLNAFAVPVPEGKEGLA